VARAAGDRSAVGVRLPLRWWASVLVALLRRPSLWATAAATARRLAAPGWWRRWPPVPAPAPGYTRFRLVTAYGEPPQAPPPADVVAYLEWCREQRRP
jgi:hypothetical protein